MKINNLTNLPAGGSHLYQHRISLKLKNLKSYSSTFYTTADVLDLTIINDISTAMTPSKLNTYFKSLTNINKNYILFTAQQSFMTDLSKKNIFNFSLDDISSTYAGFKMQKITFDTTDNCMDIVQDGVNSYFYFNQNDNVEVTYDCITQLL